MGTTPDGGVGGRPGIRLRGGRAESDPATAGLRRVLTVTGLCELFGLTEQDESAEQDNSLSSATGA